MEHVSEIITEHWFFLLVVAYLLCCCVEKCCQYAFGTKIIKFESKEEEDSR